MNIVVVPSPKVAVAQYKDAIIAGFKAVNAHGVKTVKMLGDNVPGVASWIERREKSAVTFEAVNTDWNEHGSNAPRERDAKLMDEAGAGIALGHVATSSAWYACRNILRAKLPLVQVIDGTATIVPDLEHLIVTDTLRVPTEKRVMATQNPRENDAWAGFADEPKKGTKKAK